MTRKWALIGLGNPDDRYDATRHNLGFQVADELARRRGGKWSYSADTYALVGRFGIFAQVAPASVEAKR